MAAWACFCRSSSASWRSEGSPWRSLVAATVTRSLRLRASLAIVAAVALVLPASSFGARELKLGVFDGDYASTDSSVRSQALDRTARAGAERVVIVATWRSIAPASPLPSFDAANPGDPGYAWQGLDTAVNAAAAHGLKPILLVTSAPDWAEGAGGADAPAGTWKPDPQAVGDFGRAIARRYSGDYPGAGGTLPRAGALQLWAEPNLSLYLNPQWDGRRAAAAVHYRRMLNAFYAGVKAVDRKAVVVTGGTAPYGDPRGGDRMRPLRFWREILCLRKKGKRKLRAKRCREKAAFDVLAHHPINTSGGPHRSAAHPDDVSTPDVKHLRRTLRVAERKGNLRGPKRHQLWATEIWWESNPPDRARGVKLRRHARWLEEALYLLWKQGARLVVNLQIRDAAYDPQAPLTTVQSGLYLRNWTPKPALRAFRFPFVADRISKRTLRAWGKAPAGGKLKIQKQRKGGWRRIEAFRVRAGSVFSEKIHVRGAAKLRAQVAGETSLVWRVRG
jgi:hypothetical protein